MLDDCSICTQSPEFSFVSLFLISLIKLTLRLKFSTDKRRRTRGVGTGTTGSRSVSPRQKLLGLCMSGLSRSFQRVLQSDRSDLSTSNFKDFFYKKEKKKKKMAKID